MDEEHQSKIKATWLGHAFFVLERGTRVLFDPGHSPSELFEQQKYPPGAAAQD